MIFDFIVDYLIDQGVWSPVDVATNTGSERKLNWKQKILATGLIFAVVAVLVVVMFVVFALLS